MRSAKLGGYLPEREMAIAAFALGMTDCSRAEISRAFILAELEGYTPAQAREAILAERKSASYQNAVPKVFSVKVPEDWAERARTEYPDLTPSQFFRYCCHRLTESPEDARKRAVLPRGRQPRSIAA